ncbi:MAG TPA: hypothetical protein VNU28_04765 [Solirubrobacteraceae bacterium]|nr:hypothetical protein [Solirubrobacteraceae bacterium]
MRGSGSPSCAHRPELHSIQRKRVERGASVAERVGEVLKVIGEAFVFV